MEITLTTFLVAALILSTGSYHFLFRGWYLIVPVTFSQKNEQIKYPFLSLEDESTPKVEVEDILINSRVKLGCEEPTYSYLSQSEEWTGRES